MREADYDIARDLGLRISSNVLEAMRVVKLAGDHETAFAAASFGAVAALGYAVGVYRRVDDNGTAEEVADAVWAFLRPCIVSGIERNREARL